ncbi:30S ribosomal protein S16 [Aquiflexum lacus]|uniref:30S ribosomal protein S16 n=1 Tax=Aquiflexum lacus TaxID=2483805 RepID=UPI001893937B
MAVKIRLSRRGRKKMAIYDVVVADARAPRDGRFIDKLGTYNPNTDPASININNERALKWLLNGAEPTETVKAMLSYRGVLLQKHLQIGVLKGAITQDQADEKFEAWKASKETTITGKVDKLTQAKADARQKAMDAETAKNQARLDAIKKREADAIAAAAPPVVEAPVAEEAPAAPAEEEAPKAAAENVAPVAPTEEETPKATTKEEAPAPTTEEDAPKASKEEEAPAAAAEETTPDASAEGEEPKA